MYAGPVASRFSGRIAGPAIALLLIAEACASATATPSPTAPANATPVATASASATAPSATAASAAPGTTGAPKPTGTVNPFPTPSPTALPGTIPAFKHVYVIVMENKEYGSIVGPGRAPYLNGLIAHYGLATNFYAESHPSEPNYIALAAGGLLGVSTDGAYNLSAPNLFDQVEASGRTWHVYAQGYPGGCYKGSLGAGVVDGPGAAGEYVRKHNPAISFTSISGNPSRCANITHLAGFDPAAANLEFIVPNLINDMHSSSVAAGDAFLATFVPRIVDSASFAGSALFITWDEGSTSVNGGGHVATLVVSPGMTPGFRSATRYTHYSILRTIEQAWGMPLLGNAATAAPMALPY